MIERFYKTHEKDDAITQRPLLSSYYTKILKSAIFRGLENHEQRIKKYPSRGQQQQQQQQQQQKHI